MLNHVGMAEHHVLDKNFYMHMDISGRRRRPPGGYLPVRRRPGDLGARRELQGPRARQPLRRRHQLLPEHRRGEPGARRRWPTRGDPAASPHPFGMVRGVAPPAASSSAGAPAAAVFRRPLPPLPDGGRRGSPSAIAGLGCSALLPLDPAFAQEDLVAICGASAGPLVIASYQRSARGSQPSAPARSRTPGCRCRRSSPSSPVAALCWPPAHPPPGHPHRPDATMAVIGDEYSGSCLRSPRPSRWEKAFGKLRRGSVSTSNLLGVQPEGRSDAQQALEQVPRARCLRHRQRRDTQRQIRNVSPCLPPVVRLAGAIAQDEPVLGELVIDRQTLGGPARRHQARTRRSAPAASASSASVS